MCMGMSMVDVGHILDCSFIFFIEESLSTKLVACQGSLILCLWYAFYCEKNHNKNQHGEEMAYFLLQLLGHNLTLFQGKNSRQGT